MWCLSEPRNNVCNSEFQDALNSIEYIFYWTVNWIVWSTEYKSVPRIMNHSCHLSIVMRSREDVTIRMRNE